MKNSSPDFWERESHIVIIPGNDQEQKYRQNLFFSILLLWFPLYIKELSSKKRKLYVKVFTTTTNSHLSIVDEIDWEDEDPDCRVDETENLHIDSDQGKDGDHQAKEDEDKEDAEEDPATHCEINLGLKLFCFDT